VRVGGYQGSSVGSGRDSLVEGLSKMVYLLKFCGRKGKGEGGGEESGWGG